MHWLQKYKRRKQNKEKVVTNKAIFFQGGKTDLDEWKFIGRDSARKDWVIKCYKKQTKAIKGIKPSPLPIPTDFTILDP